MKVGVLTFPGSNCDRDLAVELTTNVEGLPAAQEAREGAQVGPDRGDDRPSSDPSKFFIHNYARYARERRTDDRGR